MVINVSIQYNGGFLPDIIMLTLRDYIAEPFQYHEELLFLQPKFPPKPFGILRCFDLSSKNRMYVYVCMVITYINSRV